MSGTLLPARPVERCARETRSCRDGREAPRPALCNAENDPTRTAVGRIRWSPRLAKGNLCVAEPQLLSVTESSQLRKRAMLSDCACAHENGIGWDAKRSPARIGPTAPIRRESFSPSAWVVCNGSDMLVLEDSISICGQPDVLLSRACSRVREGMKCRYARAFAALRHCGLWRDRSGCVTGGFQASTSAGSRGIHYEHSDSIKQPYFTRSHILVAI